jgi:preprotein translocase subunit SecE
MSKLGTFISESYEELMDHVSWPKWSNLQQSTMIVIGATLFITALVAVMDLGCNFLMKGIYSIF